VVVASNLTHHEGNIMEQQLCFSLKEAASKLHISRTSLHRLIKDAEIRSFAIGGRRLISFQAMSEYITKKESEPLVLVSRKKREISA
jgi:excisionase family DNA binding protein